MINKKSKKNESKMKKVLDTVLKVEANSASCIILYQPKTPKELSKFKK